jgi:hypothetical protein
MDLLTVLEHEVGHLLGHEADRVLSETLGSARGRRSGAKPTRPRLPPTRPLLFSPPMGILIIMPMAGDIATALYYTGIDPFTKKDVYVGPAEPGLPTGAEDGATPGQEAEVKP